jgi:DNA-binding transcriptional regulator LsrR (DeoR family)
MAKKNPESLTHEELVERACSVAKASALTQRQIADRLGISQPTVNRALSKGETRDAAVLQAILRELAGEVWERVILYNRTSHFNRTREGGSDH